MRIRFNFSDNLGHNDGPVILPGKQVPGRVAQPPAVTGILHECLDYLLEAFDFSFGDDVAALSL
jgi:hypothetical protein